MTVTVSITAEEIPSRQEMFNRAWRGLEAQGWQGSVVAKAYGGSRCVYNGPDGRRCAWGHVDPEGTRDPGIDVDGNAVMALHTNGIGLAALLTEADALFALRLQRAHDGSSLGFGPGARDLRKAMTLFAESEGLTIPESAPPAAEGGAL